jgi:GTP-binding protein Era
MQNYNRVEENGFKSGFAAIIGVPNAGKSTLMNTLIGEKISIVSNRPQTTRNNILSILTTDVFQAVFIDTPGIHSPKDKLGEYMQKCVGSALDGVDIIFFVVDPKLTVSDENKMIIERLSDTKTPVFLIINKVDIVEKPKVLEIINAYSKLRNFAEIIPISALKAQNTDRIFDLLEKYLPHGPMYYSEDMITDQPERQIVAELIREKVLRFMYEEIPHGVAVEINEMKPRNEKLYDVTATIFCDKKSHKSIIIGKDGEMLKRIGTSARHSITALLGSNVYLQLWVKVRETWRNNDTHLRSFGYDNRKV